MTRNDAYALLDIINIRLRFAWRVLRLKKGGAQ